MQVTLSTQTRTILICGFSIVGLFISNFGADICNFIVKPTMILVDGVERFKFQAQKEAWWELRMIIAEVSDVICYLIPKFFSGFPIPNLIFNIGIWYSLSDCIGRIGGDTDRDIYDFIWFGTIALLSIYECRNRIKYNQ